MSYESWRISYQSSEQAARAAYQQMEALNAERDALAALFLKLQDAATDLIHSSNEEEAGDAMELIAECSEEEARSILARRDALKQAEALEEAAGETVPSMHQMANWLLARAADKRKQAEGHQ